jgi:hypothetical protein
METIDENGDIRLKETIVERTEKVEEWKHKKVMLNIDNPTAVSCLLYLPWGHLVIGDMSGNVYFLRDFDQILKGDTQTELTPV